MNYVLAQVVLTASTAAGQAHNTRLTSCIHGIPKKFAPADSRGEEPARLAPLRKRQQLRVIAQAFIVARPLAEL